MPPRSAAAPGSALPTTGIHEQPEADPHPREECNRDLHRPGQEQQAEAESRRSEEPDPRRDRVQASDLIRRGGVLWALGRDEQADPIPEAVPEVPPTVLLVPAVDDH